MLCAGRQCRLFATEATSIAYITVFLILPTRRFTEKYLLKKGQIIQVRDFFSILATLTDSWFEVFEDYGKLPLDYPN